METKDITRAWLAGCTYGSMRFAIPLRNEFLTCGRFFKPLHAARNSCLDKNRYLRAKRSEQIYEELSFLVLRVIDIACNCDGKSPFVQGRGIGTHEID